MFATWIAKAPVPLLYDNGLDADNALKVIPPNPANVYAGIFNVLLANDAAPLAPVVVSVMIG